jgi:allantoinase
VGVWRILREFERRGLPLTVFGVCMALQRHPEVTRAFVDLGHEIACHGWRWINYQQLDEATERAHVLAGIDAIRQLTGQVPLGWYTGRDSPNTRRLLVDVGGFEYDSDSDGDDLPFSTRVRRSDGSDVRFALPQGCTTGDDFFAYLRGSFDALWAEGAETPRMMSVGMHCRLLGRPVRIGALQRFLDHVARHEQAWVPNDTHDRPGQHRGRGRRGAGAGRHLRALALDRRGRHGSASVR